MKKQLITLLIAITTFVSAGGYVLAALPLAAVAQTPKDAACEGLQLTGAPANCAEDPTQPSVNSTLELAINIFSWVVGLTAVFMIIIGGFKYITSSGNDQSVNSAKNTILFAIVGLVIVALAQVIVRFVISEATAPPVPPG